MTRFIGARRTAFKSAGSSALTTFVFPIGSSTWTAPAGVTVIKTAIGKGTDSYSDVYQSNYYIGYGLCYPGSTTGSTPGGLDYSTIYGAALNVVNTCTTGGARFLSSEITYYQYWLNTDNTYYLNTYNNSGIYVYGSGGGSTSNGYGDPTSGAIPYGGYHIWFAYVPAIAPGSSGSQTYMTGTGFTTQYWNGATQVGNYPNATGQAATLSTINNIAVTPGTTYNIYNNGSLTFYY